MKASLVKKSTTLNSLRLIARIRAVFFIVDFSDSVKLVAFDPFSSGILPKTLEM
jgi:hypothetical protein